MNSQGSPSDGAAAGRSQRRGRIVLVLLFVMFASPVIASYLTYYVFPPEGRTNYGELISPQKALVQVSGSDFDVSRFRGKWVMLTAFADQDEAALKERLYAIRQVRLTTGKDMDRVERLLVLIDTHTPSAALLAQHEGMIQVRMNRSQWDTVFGQPPERILIVDPIGHLMMRFPLLADPNKIKKDLSKLLRASRIG